MTSVNLKPAEEFDFSAGKGDVLLIACGALAREIVDLIENKPLGGIRRRLPVGQLAQHSGNGDGRPMQASS